MTTALVTGGTGFIGAHVARALVEAGVTVRILRRATSRLDLVQDLPVEHFIGDVLDPASLRAPMQGVDWVFHVAALADYWRTSDVEQIYRVNVDGTRNVLQAAEAARVRRVIVTSSAAAVGHRRDLRAVDESVRFNWDPHLTPYGHSKFLAEAEVYRAIRRGLDCVILNPTVVIGPGDLNEISSTVVLEMARGGIPPTAPPGGVTLIDVRDVAAAHVAAAQRGRTGERYILGTVDLSHKAWLRLTAAAVGRRALAVVLPAWIVLLVASAVDVLRRVGVPIQVEGNQLRLSTHDMFYDPRKAWRELGEPRISIQQSLRDTYEWYREQGKL